MFTDKVDRKDFHKMPEAYKDLLIRLLIVQTDSELGGPDLYLHSWVRDAPTVEDQRLLAKTAFEEIDHRRRFAKILEDLGVDTKEITAHSREERILEGFRQPLDDWVEMGPSAASSTGSDRSIWRILPIAATCPWPVSSRRFYRKKECISPMGKRY